MNQASRERLAALAVRGPETCPFCRAPLPPTRTPPPYLTPFQSVAAWYAHWTATRGPGKRPTLGWLALRTGLKRSTVQDCRRRYEALGK